MIYCLFPCSTVSRLLTLFLHISVVYFSTFMVFCGVFLHIPRLYTFHLLPYTKIAIKHNRYISPYNKKESVFKEICRNYLRM